jgi:hypothetical protein
MAAREGAGGLILQRLSDLALPGSFREVAVDTREGPHFRTVIIEKVYRAPNDISSFAALGTRNGINEIGRRDWWSGHVRAPCCRTGGSATGLSATDAWGHATAGDDAVDALIG